MCLGLEEEISLLAEGAVCVCVCTQEDFQAVAALSRALKSG